MNHLLALAAAKPAGQPILLMLREGGTIGYVIMGLSIVALAYGVYLFSRIRVGAMAPLRLVDELHVRLASGRVDDAAALCADAQYSSFLSRTMQHGLNRYRRSAFGALELRGALEEAGQEQVARLNRLTDALAVIAAVAPMLGLLGTVVGLYGAFKTVARSAGIARPDQLAGDVSLALMTTIQGLVVAIPVVAMVTFFRNRIEANAAVVAEIAEELIADLESGKVGAAPTPEKPARPAAPRTLTPAPSAVPRAGEAGGSIAPGTVTPAGAPGGPGGAGGPGVVR